MIIRNRISRITGPSEVFAGYLLFVFGLATIYFTWTSIPVALLGAAMAFSYNASVIDFGSKRYRPLLVLFGFIPLGAWADLDPADQLSVKEFKGSYASFSRGNRLLSTPVNDYRVILVRGADQKKITLACFDDPEKASGLMTKIQSLLEGD